MDIRYWFLVQLQTKFQRTNTPFL